MSHYRGYRYVGSSFMPSKDPYRKIFTKNVWIWIAVIFGIGLIIQLFEELANM